MSPARKPWAWCREPGCDTKIIFAVRASDGQPRPYEYADRDPASIESVGCHVLIGGQSFTPREALEHFQVTREITTEKANELVAGYPHHRPHGHEPRQAP